VDSLANLQPLERLIDFSEWSTVRHRFSN